MIRDLIPQLPKPEGWVSPALFFLKIFGGLLALIAIGGLATQHIFSAEEILANLYLGYNNRLVGTLLIFAFPIGLLSLIGWLCILYGEIHDDDDWSKSRFGRAVVLYGTLPAFYTAFCALLGILSFSPHVFAALMPYMLPCLPFCWVGAWFFVGRKQGHKFPTV